MKWQAGERFLQQNIPATAAAAALLVLGVGLLSAMLADLVATGETALEFGLLGFGVAAAGGVLWWVSELPEHRSPIGVLGAVVLAYLVMVSVSAVAYLVTGATERVDDALFESVAGFTTTSLSILDPETLPQGLLWWRAVTQWLGGAAALIFVVAVVPLVGGQLRLVMPFTGRTAPRTSLRIFSGPVGQTLLVYSGFTVVMAAAYLGAGMGVFDALTFGLTTASTGGFANYGDSLAHFDSVTVEWTAAVGMLLAGMSVVLLAWLARGRVRVLWRSTELQLYLAIMLASIGGVTAWTWQDTDGGMTTVREAAVTVTSSMSTTGYRVTDWSGWTPAPQLLLLLLIGVGTMAASAGGGFRVLRLLQLVGIARRELLLQLHPKAVVAVKVSDVKVSEESVNRAHGYQMLSLLAIGAGTFGLAALGSDLPTAVSGAVSALSSAGPALGDLAGHAGAEVLAAPARAVFMVLMLLGRLSIYPVLMVLTSVAVAIRRGAWR